MTRRNVILLAAVLALHAFGAQPDDVGWTKVQRLRPGQALRALCSGQQTWTGRLVAASDETLTLDVGGFERKIIRSDVVRVDVKSRARSALIGLGIGAPAGLGFGYLAGSRANLKSDEKTASAGLGAGLFAAAGAVIGALLPGWKTVYRGEPPGPLPPAVLPAK